MTTIKWSPALSPEEWELAKRRESLGPRERLPDSEAARRVEFPTRRAAAALALYGQPWGFSARDVEILRQIPAFLHGAGMANDPEGAGNFIRDLTDRIKALLPPESDT